MFRCFRLFVLGGSLASCLLLSAAATAYAQETPGRDALGEALSAGDAQTLLRHATERVEVSLPDGGSQYSRSQAVYVLGRFFERHPPRRYAWEQGSTKERSRFLAGRYWPEGGAQPFSVNLRLTEVQGDWRLQEVRISRP